jgi:hypothetical protein
MQALNKLGITKWYRNVDDIFATIKCKDQANTILEFLNSKSQIRFTIEHEDHNKLPFLDTCVVRQRTRYITTVYRKKTFTRVYLNWTSLTSRRYKVGLFKCLAERIWRIFSVEKNRKSELNKLKAILRRNDYPDSVVDRVLCKFLEQKANPPIVVDQANRTGEE